MRIFVKQLSITALTLGLSLVAVGQTTQPMSELMSEQEIEAMGLDKLSPAQQADLVQWIQQRREAAITAESGEAATNTATATTATTATTAANTIPDKTTASTAPTVAAAATTVEGPSDDNFGKPAPQADQMRSRIPGTFTGWTGGSQFVLENGQVWQQRYDTRWKTELDNPEVIITRHMLGLHRMEVVGTGKSVPVKRIK